MIFTRREQEFIRLLVERGLSTKEASWELRISDKTGQVHRNNIMIKLRDALGYGEFEILSAVDLTLYAICNGLVDMKLIEKKYSVSAIPSPS